MDLGKWTILRCALLGFLCCVVASVAIGASAHVEQDAIQRLYFATGSALFFVSPAAIAFYVARESGSSRPFMTGLLSGGLGGAVYSVLVTALVFGGDIVATLGSVGFALVLSAVGALLGLLVSRRDAP